MSEQMIDIDYLKQLLEIFDASSVHDLRIEREGVEIRLSKSARRDEAPAAHHYAPVAAPAAAPPTAAAAPAEPAAAAQLAADDTSAPIHEIVSPIVGTFYRAPSPDAEPFIEIGSHVLPGGPLCIIEAMKLMNEIESDVAGQIVKICVENGQAVEYGQPLFHVKLD